jgi:hypothetical protein
MNVLFFYLSIVRRGIFFLHKCIGNKITHQNWVIDPDLAYTVIFCEAFNDKNLIVGAIMPQRLPIATSSSGNTPVLKEFQYSQYVQFKEFGKTNKILAVKGKYNEHKKFLAEDPDLYKAFIYSETNLRNDRPKNEL